MDDSRITYELIGEKDELQSIYEDLPTTGRYIRMLTFNQEHLPHNDPISINLETYDLDSETRPSYWALSYTWGNPLPSRAQIAPSANNKRIICNGQPFEITENLFEFMKRYGDKKHYWIDAVCINQKNDQEKNAQVNIMIWIYTKAAGTFVWLGVEDEAARKTHDLIVEFVKGRNKLGADWKEICNQDWKFNDKGFFDKMGLEPWSTDDWKSILDFFARSWFHRQLVVQEVIAQKSLVVFCGDRGMKWESLILFIHFIARTQWDRALQQIESEFHRSGTTTGINAAFVFVYMSDLKSEGPEKWSTNALLDIVSDYRTYSERFDAFTLYNVYRMRGRKASNLADHVYASLSLARKFQRDVDTLYPVNYEQTTREVYTNFSAYLMRVPRPMVLAFREDDTRRRLKQLPSWVPDYSVEGDGTPLGMRKRYEACGKDILRPYDKAHVVCKDRLYMKGVFVDSISELTGEIRREASAESAFELLKLAFYTDQSLKHEPRLESLIRTLCANDIEEKPVGKDNIFVAFATWFGLVALNPEYQVRLHESLGEIDSQDWDDFWKFGNETLRAQTKDENVTFASVEAWNNSEHLTSILLTLIFQRKYLALTRNRRALSLAPLSAKPGDEIWILFNGRTPYILRKLDGEQCGYYFVGEAYVHGFMYGELFLRDKENGLDVEPKEVVLI